jgi:ATP-dependent helicase/DNAse subunit B
MTDDFQTWLETHIFTPSELESFLLCPFRFYAEAFLGLRELPEREPELTPREIGILMHRILERFLGGKDWSQESLGKIADSILDRFEKERPGLSHPLFLRQRARIERTLDSFYDLEVAGVEKRENGLRPKYFEWSFGTEEAPPLTISDNPPIRIRGRIDRIDVDPKRKLFLVIDYKTGSRKITGREMTEGRALALPLYILAAERLLLPDHQPVGGLFFHLSDMTKETGLLHADRFAASLDLHPKKSSLIPGGRWNETLQGIEDQVRKIVGEIRKGEFPSEKEPCEPFCPFQDICRLRSTS